MKTPLPSVVYAPQEVPEFEETGREIVATLQPLSGALEATVYGEELRLMKLLLTTSRYPLAEGMGVCAERRDGGCDYRVAEPPQRWGIYQRAVLKRL